jgi:hypothetical protein
MTQFNKGQKLRVLKSPYVSIVTGDIVEVVNPHVSGNTFSATKVHGSVFELNFTPSQVEVYVEYKFKVGDNVIYNGILEHRNGKVFTVTKLNSGQFPYTIKGDSPSHAVEVYEHEITLDLTTPKFKVGQRVTLDYTTDPTSIWFGNGTVVGYDDGYTVKTDAGDRGWFYASQVKEFVPAPSRFKVGDRVKAAQSPAIAESHGKLGTVTEIDRQANTDKVTGEPGITVKWDDGISFGFGYRAASVEKFSNADLLKSLKIGAVIQFNDESGRWTKSSLKNPESSKRDYGTFHSSSLGDGYPLLLNTEGWKITVLSEGTDK